MRRSALLGLDGFRKTAFMHLENHAVPDSTEISIPAYLTREGVARSEIYPGVRAAGT